MFSFRTSLLVGREQVRLQRSHESLQCHSMTECLKFLLCTHFLAAEEDMSRWVIGRTRENAIDEARRRFPEDDFDLIQVHLRRSSSAAAVTDRTSFSLFCLVSRMKTS